MLTFKNAYFRRNSPKHGPNCANSATFRDPAYKTDQVWAACGRMTGKIVFQICVAKITPKGPVRRDCDVENVLVSTNGPFSALS